jgi:RNA polymerase sigma factor (sigma-70 family)
MRKRRGSLITRLEKIISDLQLNNITKDDALKYIEFEDWREQYNGHKKDMLLKEFLIDDCIQHMSVTPEEVFLEKERLQEIIICLLRIKSKLKPKAYDILWLYIVKGKTQEEIAVDFNVSQSAIAQYIKRISKKIKNDIINMYPSGTYIEELFKEPQSTLEAHSPTVNGYPYEFLQDVADEGEWRTYKNGRKRYITKSKCVLPEYFQECFGDPNTKCSLCFGQFDGDNKCKIKANIRGGEA